MHALACLLRRPSLAALQFTSHQLHNQCCTAAYLCAPQEIAYEEHLARKEALRALLPARFELLQTEYKAMLWGSSVGGYVHLYS